MHLIIFVFQFFVWLIYPHVSALSGAQKRWIAIVAVLTLVPLFVVCMIDPVVATGIALALLLVGAFRRVLRRREADEDP